MLTRMTRMARMLTHYTHSLRASFIMQQKQLDTKVL